MSLTPVLYIFLLYLFHSAGELCLSPVGLSVMNRLAPAHMAGLIMGTWFFASAAGNFAAGLIAAATGSEGAGADGARDGSTTGGWSAGAVGVLDGKSVVWGQGVALRVDRGGGRIM